MPIKAAEYMHSLLHLCFLDSFRFRIRLIQLPMSVTSINRSILIAYTSDLYPMS
ncbi:hypothetical protein Hanom_Chr14g01304281 [Helianthus anomalus]